MRHPFRHFDGSPEVTRVPEMMYARQPPSIRPGEDVPFGRGPDLCHAAVQFWWNRFGPTFAAEIRKKWPAAVRSVNAGPVATSPNRSSIGDRFRVRSLSLGDELRQFFEEPTMAEFGDWWDGLGENMSQAVRTATRLTEP